MDMEHEIKKDAPSAQQAAGSIADDPQYKRMLWNVAQDWTRTDRHIALACYIERWADSRAAATPAQPIAPQPEPMTTDEAREFLIGFMNEHFTDRTFYRYIRADPVDKSRLAGDFAWQMATALRKIGASPCAMCHGTGSVGHAPDDYFDCPDCTAPVAQPAADVSAPTDEDELLALVPEREIMKLWGMCAYWGPVDTRVVPFARAVIRSAIAARAAAPVSGPTEDTLTKLHNRVKEMQEAAYTFGEYSKEAVSAALDGVLDEIAAISAAPVSGQGDSAALIVRDVAELYYDGKFNPKKLMVVSSEDLTRIVNRHIDSRPRSEDSRAFPELPPAAIGLHDDGYFTWRHGNGPDKARYAGWKGCAFTADQMIEAILADRALASTTPQKADNE